VRNASLTHYPARTDSPHWRETKANNPRFASNPRNIYILGCADGCSVWNDKSGVFPILMEYLNLEPAIRGKYHNIDVYGIVYGSKPKNTDILYELFVDDLLDMWHNGFKCWDSRTGKVETLRAMLVAMTFDYKGLTDGARRMDVGAYQACCICNLQGCRSEELDKMLYRMSAHTGMYAWHL